jgi:hypothetical protein
MPLSKNFDLKKIYMLVTGLLEVNHFVTSVRYTRS